MAKSKQKNKDKSASKKRSKKSQQNDEANTAQAADQQTKTDNADNDTPNDADMMDAAMAYTIRDPEAFAANFAKFLELGSEAIQRMGERGNSQTGAWSAADELSEAAKSLTELYARSMNDPTSFAKAQNDLTTRYMDIWANVARQMTGERVEPVIAPDPGDNRWKDDDYTTNPFFGFWKQSYLATTKWAEQQLGAINGLDEHERHKAEFHLRQLSSALSPSNFIMTNPEVMRETLQSNADNLVKGMTNLVEDLGKSKDLLKISQTDTEQFEVGKNLAVTPGKVVFQNNLLQLIQYEPSTPEVHKTPLLIVPPWINKFYILDLRPEKSFIKHAVDAGFTVFVISWVNPNEKLAEASFEDYMQQGILEAAKAVKKATGEKQTNVLGYCVGGTLLGATLAYTAAKKSDIFKSATFLTTQVDFSKGGDLLVFIDDAQLRSLETMMAERGYLDGSRMANVFNMLRPRDLIWPYVINNYMLGKKPFPFDLLYWNQDSTRMPARNHAFYLRALYKENRLGEGKLTMGGIKLDLAKVKLPIYELAAREDHIAPAESVFIGSKMFGGPVKFVLSGSGHIAGVINPPAKQKYQYWLNDEKASTLENWLENAEEIPGSWWHHWYEWLGEQSGDMVKPRTPGDGKLDVIEDAPGSYVKERG